LFLLAGSVISCQKLHSKMVLSQLPILKKIWPDFLTKAIDTISVLSVITRYDIKQGIVTAILLFFILTYGVLPLNAMAEHGTQTWNSAIKSVVIVNPTWPGYTKPGFGAPAGTAPAGSGVYFSVNESTSKYILTAAHVISRATDIEIVDYSGRTLSAVIHAIDERRDIAFLKTEVKGPVIPLGIGKIPIGSHVCAIGNSFGLGHSLSCGVVSAVNRQNIGFNEIEDFIQTDAAINPGSSGGALVDSAGRFVGLIDGIFTKDADIDAGVNFAISLSLIKVSLSEMQSRGISFNETK